MNNFILVVLDGVGVGELPDADKFNDRGSNTLGNIALALDGISLPNLEKAGLGNIIPIKGLIPQEKPLASYGKMAEKSSGKDSTTGHWEIGGMIYRQHFPLYPDGFPERIISRFIELTGCGGVLGNKAASGTKIIEELGDEHCKTGYPIVYTSADSVFQIAAHEKVIPLDKLYEMCITAREKIFTGKDSLGRVIARPFIGDSGNYTRTTSRKDFSVDPPGKTILDLLLENDIETVAIGKINDLFNHRGIKTPVITKSNMQGVDAIIKTAAEKNNSLIFANLVDFDVYYGHRNDTPGFYSALKEFDDRLPAILESTDESDIVILTADHGNDPTTESTDHSREYVPLICFRKGTPGVNLGARNSFADVAKTAADFFSVKNELDGVSFLNG